MQGLHRDTYRLCKNYRMFVEIYELCFTFLYHTVLDVAVLMYFYSKT